MKRFYYWCPATGCPIVKYRAVVSTQTRTSRRGHPGECGGARPAAFFVTRNPPYYTRPNFIRFPSSSSAIADAAATVAGPYLGYLGCPNKRLPVINSVSLYAAPQHAHKSTVNSYYRYLFYILVFPSCPPGNRNSGWAVRPAILRCWWRRHLL